MSIRREFEKTKSKFDNKLHTFFTSEPSILKYLNKTVTDKIIEDVASQEKIVLTKKFGTSYNLEQIRKNTLTYFLCLLHTYGKGGTKSLEDLVGEYFTGADNERNESLALVFGIYTGYSSLRNYYKVRNEKINVKFELDSKLQSYIIESVYNYVTKGNLISGEFDFIDKEFVTKIKPKRNPDYEQYIVMGTLISIRKKDYSEHLIRMIKEITEEITSFFPTEFLTVDKNSLAKHFYRKFKAPFSNIVEEIKDDIKDTIKSEELEDTIVPPKRMSLSDLKSETKKEIIPDDSKTKEGKFTVIKKKSPNQQSEDLFAGLKTKNQISEQAIKKAKTIPKLKALAEDCGITLPSKISKKQQIIDYLLSKCSDN